jgi:hypothetical protein
MYVGAGVRAPPPLPPLAFCPASLLPARVCMCMRHFPCSSRAVCVGCASVVPLTLQLKAALETLSTVGRVEVNRETLPTRGFRWLITFSGCRVVSGVDVCNRGGQPLLVADDAALTGGSGTGSFAQVTGVVTGHGNSTSPYYGFASFTDLSSPKPFTVEATNLTPGLQYFFRVSARNTQVRGVVTPPPKPPHSRVRWECMVSSPRLAFHPVCFSFYVC